MIEERFKSIPDTYEIIEIQYVEEMHGWTALLSHKKTKARVLLVSNDDTNKVFNIAFRTPVSDSTGVPHIIEHTVLCGSDEFPMKDPFVELVKGSLNTFLNAMTYPDKTMYPVASCNDKDFQNLMHVYLDAVFHPNIYKNKMIFEQEGWHYELEDQNDDLKVNGVVYNEMKGAFSSPEEVLFREIPSALYPDINYSCESGGAPDVIPELTYEQYLDFHRTYYHPSNSYIYLYGDFDIREKLTFIDEHYLSQYDYKFVDSEIKKQCAFDAMVRREKYYSISSEDDAEDKTFFSYSTVIEDSLDPELYVAFQVLEYVLLSSPGAVLKKALLESGIAGDVFGNYENGISQPYFAIIAKNSNPECENRFMEIIRETLTELVNNGIQRKTLEAALNYFEFKFREADFGRYPKGLMFGLQMFDSWLYDDAQPLTHIRAFKTFDALREKLDTDYYEQLIQKYLLDNHHSALLILKPKKGLTAENDEAFAQKMASYKASLTDEEIQAIIDETKALRFFQDTPSTQEELEKIPMIEISDIQRAAMKITNQKVRVENFHVLKHDIETNGINYFKLLFEIDDITDELLPYAGLLTNVLGSMNTEKYDYTELTDEINLHTGGISTDISLFNRVKKGDYKTYFIVTGKALEAQSQTLAELMQEMILKTDFTDTKRLKEIISQIKSRMSAYISGNGHSVASLRAMAYYDESAYVRDMINGVGFYEFIKKLDENFESAAPDTVHKLQQLCQKIFRKDNVLFDLTSKETGFNQMIPGIASFEKALFAPSGARERLNYKPEQKNEGLMTSGMVQFDAAAGNFAEKGFSYHGALQILKVIMNYDYLWQNIRVKGGAYGCMSNFTSAGNAYFVTYRDPHLKESFNVFKEAAEYIRHFDCSPRDMTKYIIGAISNIDTPLTPAAEGARSLALYLTESTYEEVQKRRDELLDATVETIRSFGDLIDAFVSQNHICVVGSESEIKANETMFNSIRNI